MAASVGAMAGASDESSSSDEEALKRCQEAVWETRSDKNKDDNSVKPSKRVVVDVHEHDGNELQVTQGFRTHVAKKLGHFLDSYITELQPETSSCVKSAKYDDDEGFRLFSTSFPGKTAEDLPAPVKHRPVPSSSDSDSEMESRLREAAVSVEDLLLSSSQPSANSPTTTEPPCSEKARKKKKTTEGEERQFVKKNKKRKHNQEDGAQVDPLHIQSNGVHRRSKQEYTQVKAKTEKQKKQRKENSEEEALN